MNDVYTEDVSGFFYDNNYESIAIYGMGYEGKRLFESLKETNVYVIFGLDKRASEISMVELPIYTIEESLHVPEVEAIIVTPYKWFREIESSLEPLFPSLDIISLDDVKKYKYLKTSRKGLL